MGARNTNLVFAAIKKGGERRERGRERREERERTYCHTHKESLFDHPEV